MKKKRNIAGKEILVESLKLPRDTVLGESIITLTGKKDVLIENYKGIISCNDAIIWLQTKHGKICLEGRGLNIVYYTNEDMKITGTIEHISIV
ncbi:MAG: YabP/YqfC family sporulation protein [Lachnospiraceae bacterium]|nr:YabP/YqfC family sporulation protein [Lachnospiraceae bacterium]